MVSPMMLAVIFNLGVLPVKLTASIITHESNGNSRAVSSVGAKGLMQLTPIAIKDVIQNKNILPRVCGWVTLDGNMFKDFDNILAGTCFYKLMLIQFKGDHDLAVRAYNCGNGCVRSWLAGKRKLPKETIDYHKRVMATWKKLEKKYGDTLGKYLSK